MMCETSATAKELRAFAGWTNHTKFKNRILNPLIDDGLLEMTIPDKPNSRLQKYRLTDKGCRSLGNKPVLKAKSISKKESKTKVKAR